MTIDVSNGFVHIYGRVLDVVWEPPFDIDLGVVKCHFESNPTQKLSTSNYHMRCDFHWNTTEQERYVPIPLTMLKSFEEIQTSDKEYASMKAVMIFSVLLSTAFAVILMAYLVYNEYWVYRD